MKMFTLKPQAVAGFAGLGGVVALLFGGWDTALQTLVILMAVDFITGMLVAGVFQRSGKSRSGALESRAGWKGLSRKGVTLLIVLVAHQLDWWAGTDFIRSAVVCAYVVMEAVSITENAGLMGIPIPEPLKNAIEVLKKRGEDTQ